MFVPGDSDIIEKVQILEQRLCETIGARAGAAAEERITSCEKKRARPIPDSPHVPSLISHADVDAADDALTNFDKKEGRKIEECLLGDLRKLKLGRVNEVP